MNKFYMLQLPAKSDKKSLFIESKIMEQQLNHFKLSYHLTLSYILVL